MKIFTVNVKLTARWDPFLLFSCLVLIFNSNKFCKIDFIYFLAVRYLEITSCFISRLNKVIFFLGIDLKELTNLVKTMMYVLLGTVYVKLGKKLQKKKTKTFENYLL